MQHLLYVLLGVLLRERSAGGERLAGNPLGRGAGSRLLHHLVDLLEGQTLGLGDQEVGVHEGAGAKTAPDEEHRGLQVSVGLADHVGGDDGNNLGMCELWQRGRGAGL